MMFITVLLYMVVSISLGLFLIGILLNAVDVVVILNYPEPWDALQTAILPPVFRLSFGILGVVIILAVVRHLQAIISRRQKSIIFESPQGMVSITLYAIEDMLKKTLEEKKEVSQLKLKVYSSKRSIEVFIRGNLTAEVNLLDFKKEIQAEVKDKLKNILGEEKETKVNIEINKIVFGAGKGVLQKDSEVPFRNYI